LDGSDERTLREARRDGWPFTSSAVSPDGTVLAVAEVEYAHCRSADKTRCHAFEQSGRVVLIDLNSLATLQDIPHVAPGLDGLRGWVSGMYWFGDSRALTVQTRVLVPNDFDEEGAVTETPGGTAVVGIDGLARRLPIDDIEIESGQPGTRNGRYAFTGATLAECAGSARVDAAIYDLQTGATVARAQPEARLVREWFAWSPDGSELLYSTLDVSGGPEPCTAIFQADQSIYQADEWAVLHTDGSPVESNVDPVAVMERWHGDRLITYACEDEGERAEPFIGCAYGPVAVTFRGQPSATNYEFQVLGWID
jgi:hypothetical protein